jgi:hypothetical protein
VRAWGNGEYRARWYAQSLVLSGSVFRGPSSPAMGKGAVQLHATTSYKAVRYLTLDMESMENMYLTVARHGGCR